MRVMTLTLVAMVWANLSVAYSETPVRRTTGEVSQVIVYRGQALVTREISVDLPVGGCEIVVERLPDAVLADSIYGIGTADATIASVRYRQKEAAEDTREEVKKLDLLIEQARREIRHTERQMQQASRLEQQYAPYWTLPATIAQRDANSALLAAESFERFTGFLEGKSEKLDKMGMELEDHREDLNKQLAELERKKAELTRGVSKVEREAVLLVNSEKAGRPMIRLNYIVNGAHWLPQYNLRADWAKGKVAVEYNALIQQSSGEDWNNVTMSLSTAQPTMTPAAPVLEPMKVGLVSGEQEVSKLPMMRGVSAPAAGKPAAAEEARQYQDLSEQFRRVQAERQQMGAKGKAAQSELNRAALTNQMIELYADKDAVQQIKKEAKRIARTEGVSVTYSLPGKLTMPSRVEQQLVGIATFEGKAEYVAVGTPLLTDYVYVQADITNDGEVAMLAGPASMYRDGEFVGKGDVPLVTVGEKFTAGFGVDGQVRIVREFEDKKIDTIFGNRIDTYEYRIAISNYKPVPVKLRLLERIPYTEDEGLEIRDFKTSVELSSDAEYQRVDRKKGLLRWDLELKPNTSEQKAAIVTYSYVTKYDKDMRIDSLGR